MGSCNSSIGEGTSTLSSHCVFDGEALGTEGVDIRVCSWQPSVMKN